MEAALLRTLARTEMGQQQVGGVQNLGRDAWRRDFLFLVGPGETSETGVVNDMRRH